jgi:hypothetical protein
VDATAAVLNPAAAPNTAIAVIVSLMILRVDILVLSPRIFLILALVSFPEGFGACLPSVFVCSVAFE